MAWRWGRHTSPRRARARPQTGRPADDAFLLYTEAVRLARARAIKRDPLPVLAAALAHATWREYARSDPSFYDLRLDPRRARIFDDLTLPDDGSVRMFDFLSDRDVRLLQARGFTQWRQLGDLAGDRDAQHHLSVDGGMGEKALAIAAGISELCSSIRYRPNGSRESVTLRARHGNLLRAAGITSIRELATTSLGDLRSRTERANRRTDRELSDRYMSRSVLDADLSEWHQAAWEIVEQRNEGDSGGVGLVRAIAERPQVGASSAVVIANTSRHRISIDRWVLADDQGRSQALRGTVDPASTVEIPLKVILLEDGSGTLVLRDEDGRTVDRVVYNRTVLRSGQEIPLTHQPGNG